MLHIEGGLFLYHNETINGTYLSMHGTCQPQSRYVWGVSFLLLFPFTLLTAPLTLALLCIWYAYHDQLWPQQVDMMFGPLRTALAVTASIRERIGDDADEMTDIELEAILRRAGAGVEQAHARSKLMLRPDPHRRRNGRKVSTDGTFALKSEKYKAYLRDGFAVGSESYKAYLRDGFASLEE